MSEDLHLPDSYYYSTVKSDENEKLMLISAFEKQQAVDAVNNKWIVKPSDACKGHGIVIFSDITDILSFFDNVTDKSVAFLIQRYIPDPLLLPNGSRKFDIRIWVLYVSDDYTVYYYQNGVCRTAACAYDRSDLNNRYAHLCNHCIATEHPDYGKYEPTNEIFFDDFNEILRNISDGAVDLETHILPQITAIICHVFKAGRDMMSSSEDYDSFMLFGFDFMLDSSYKVWLLEVNSSPAVADVLVDAVTRDLIDIAIVGKLNTEVTADRTNNGFIKIMDVNDCT
jgi:tubulin--tyrosine ligase